MSDELKHVNKYISIDTSIWMVNGWPPISPANGWQEEMEGNKTHIQQTRGNKANQAS